MSKNTNIADLINYISVDGSGNVVLTTGGQVATQSYVTTAVSNLVNAAPSTLDTLNELAAALGNDANFATTVTTSIATKQAQLNGTGFVKVSGTTVSYDNSTYLTTSSASSNYLPLVGGTLTGALSGTSATFSGNFGVGTASPSVYTNLNTITINGTSGSVIDFKTGEVLYGELYSLANELRVDAVGASGVLKLLTNSVPRLTIASTGAATFSSNVIAPQFYANFVGAGFRGIEYQNTGTIFGYSKADAGSGEYRHYIGPSAGWGGYMTFYTDNTERMRITSGGNVGIGTSSPSASVKLEVYDSSANGDVAMFSTAGTKADIWLKDVNTSAGAVRLRSESNSMIMTAGGNERMRITSTGNIGINTTTIDQRFVINQGTANAFNQGIPATSGTTQNGILRLRPSTSFFGETLDFGMNVATTYAWIQATNAGNLAVNYNLALNPNGGNVGIGTTTPSRRLHVSGTSVPFKVTSTNNSFLYELDYAGISTSYIGTFNNGLIFAPSSGSTALTIASGGNVGIGTSTPATAGGGYTGLDIRGSGGASIILGNTSSINTYLYAEFSGLYIQTTSTTPILFIPGGNERMRITSGGNVGIKVSSPDAPLHVGGAILVSNNAQTFRRAITNHGATGTFTEVKVIFNKTNWGSVTYDIKLASAGGSYHTAGAYYSNPGFSSHINSVNAGVGCAVALTAESPNGGSQGATWRFYGATMIHPMVTVDIASGNGYQVNPDDIIVQFN